MADSAIVCPVCRAPWPACLPELAGLSRCPSCQRQTTVELFPAWNRPAQQGATAERLLVEGEAACFHHAEKRAVAPCSACGRFLCALCDVEFHGQHYCPACLQSGRSKGQFETLENRRTLFDSAAFVLATLPLLLCWPVTLLTAPAAIGLAIYGWKKPSSLLPRTRVRLYLGIGIAVLTLAGWVGLAVMIASGSFRLR